MAMKRRSMLCQSVSLVPPSASGSSSQRKSCPPQLNSSNLGASARVTCVSEVIGWGAPTVDSWTVPTAARLRSESKGAQCRKCSGSVIARQTLLGGWDRFRTTISVHRSPSFWMLAPAAGPGVYRSRVMLLLSFHGGYLVHFFQMLFERVDVLRPKAAEGHEPGVEFHEGLRPEAIQAALGFDSRCNEARVSQHAQVLRNGRLREPKLTLEVTDGPLGREQQAQDGPPIGLRHDGEG